MPEVTALPGSGEAVIPVRIEPPRSPGKYRQFLAALISGIVPGSGQLMLGAKPKGILLLALFGLFILAMWPLRLLQTYAGYVCSVIILLVLTLYAALNALLQSLGPTSHRTSRWWVLVFVPIGILCCSLDYKLLTRASGFRAFTIPSASMERTLVVGDSIVSDMRYYRSHDPSRGDLVIIYRGKTYWIKRIVAIGGDIIQGFEGVIILNGKVLTEPYVEHIQVRSQLPELNTFGPVKIPAGEYFVMGDNRDVSYDSRSHDFGLLQADIIVGKPLYIIRSSAARIGTSLH